MTLLEDCNISHLFTKFNKAGTTASMIWDLPDEVLSKDVELNGVEIRRFKKARNKKTHIPSKCNQVIYLKHICI